MSLGTFALTIPKSIWLTSNDRYHWRAAANRTQAIRLQAKLAARGMTPVSVPADVLAVVHTPTNTKFDPPNAWPTVKAILDGLVDAGVIPDDSDKEIPVTSFARGPKTGAQGRYRIAIRFMDAGD